MTGLWKVSNLFVCLMLSQINAVTSIIYVESGKSVIINPNIQGKPEEISWRFNGNKLAEQDMTVFDDYGQFKGRSEIEITTGRLTVGNMTSRDSGTYVSEIQIIGKPQVETSQHQVQVIDAVQQPNVSCKLNKTPESKTLICSEPSHSQNVSYEWTGSNSAQRFGQELQISQDAEPDSVYICTARNPVSQKSISVTLRACGTADQPDQNTTLYIILGVIIGAIGVGIVTFLCIRQRKKDLRRAGVNTENDRDDSFEGSMLHLSNTRKTSNTLHVNQEDQAFIQPVEVRGHVNNEDDDNDDDDEDEDTDRKKDDGSANNSKERKTEDDDDEKNEGPERGGSENTNETSGCADEPTEAGGDADAEDEQDNNDGGSVDGPND